MENDSLVHASMLNCYTIFLKQIIPCRLDYIVESLFMSIHNFCMIFPHQKKIFYRSAIFYAFFLNLTNLNKFY